MTVTEQKTRLAETLRDVGALAGTLARPGLELSAEFLRAAMADIARLADKRLKEAEAP